MIRISKLTDYGFVILSRFSALTDASLITARDLSEDTGLPLPTVSKLLKTLSRNGFLRAHRGVKGGYTLSRRADQVTACEVIEAFEGPFGFTDCACSDSEGECGLEDNCPTKGHWKQITDVIRQALSQVTLAQLAMAEPAGSKMIPLGECAGQGCGNHTDACTCGQDKVKMGAMR